MSESGNNERNMSNHILPTSSNLLGLCFVILSFLKATKFGAETLIDEMTLIAMGFFLSSSVLSYVSIRSKRKGDFYERFADIVFLVGLSFLTLVSLFIAFELIH